MGSTGGKPSKTARAVVELQARCAMFNQLHWVLLLQKLAALGAAAAAPQQDTYASGCSLSVAHHTAACHCARTPSPCAPCAGAAA